MTIATSEVVIVADTSQFRQSARSGVRAAMTGESVRLDVTPNTVGFRGSVRNDLRNLPAVRITLDPQTQQAIRAVRQSFATMRALQVPIGIRAGDLRNQIREGIRELPPMQVTVTADRRALIRSIETALRGWRFQVNIRAILEPDWTRFDSQIARRRRPSIDVDVNANVDRNKVTKSLTSALSGIGKAAAITGKSLAGLLAFGAVGIAMAAATVSAVGLLAALAPLVGIAGAIPATIFGLVGAFAALKIALSGVGDAFGAALSGDSKKFDESLKGLAPDAQAAAREVRDLKPALDDLKKSVQQAFFRQIRGDITETAKALGGPLKTGLTDIAREWGRAADGVIHFVRSSAGVADIIDILNGSRDAVGGLARATGPVAKGLLDIAAAISIAFGQDLASGIESAGKRFGAFLTEAAGSGRAFDWVFNAITTIAHLGDLFGNIGDIIGGVFRAANVDGIGFLTNLQNITRQAATFVNSIAGQTAIGNIFTALRSVAAQLGPIIAALLTQVGSLGPGLVSVFNALGPAIVGVLNALGPALLAIIPGIQAVATELASGFDVLGSSGGLQAAGKGIGDLLAAAAPLLPLIGGLAGLLLNVLGPAVSGISALLAPFIQALSQELLPVLGPVGRAFGALFTAMQPLAAVIGQALGEQVRRIADAFRELGVRLGPSLPTLKEFAKTLLEFAASRVVPAIVDMITAFGTFQVVLIGALGTVIGWGVAFKNFVDSVIDGATRMKNDVVNFFTDMWARTKEIFNSGVESTKQFFTDLWTSITDGISTGSDQTTQFFSDMWSNITTAVSTGIDSVVGFFTGMWDSITTAVSTGIDAVVAWFTGLPDRIVAGLQQLGPMLIDLFTTAVADTVLTIVAVGVNIQNFFRALPEQIGTALSDLGTTLVNAFSTGWTAVTDWLATAFDAMVLFFFELPGRIFDTLVVLGTVLVGAFSTAWTAVTDWLTGAFDATVAAFTAFPDRAGAALATLGTAIGDQFTAAFDAATATLTGWIDSTMTWFSQVPDRAGSALSRLGSAIGAQFTSAFNSATATVSGWINSTAAWFSQLPTRASDAMSTLGSAIAGKINEAKARAEETVNSLISGVASLFSNLGSRIASAMGDIGGQIVAKIKAGLPDAIRGYLPFAAGGIVSGPTRALIGEAGREVVIPLTRPWRARELARESGLLDLLNRGGGGNTRTTTVNAPMTVNLNSGASDPRAAADFFADGVVRRLGLGF